MSGDAFLTEPAAGVGRAAPASAQALLLDQEFDSGTLYALRAAVQAHAGQAGLSEDRTGEVVLAIHELAANAIAHGAGHGRLRMWERAGALSCEIVDAGPGGAGRPTGPSPGGAGRPTGPSPGHAGRPSAPSPGRAGRPTPSPDGAGHPTPSPDGAGHPTPSPGRAGHPTGPSEAADPWPTTDGHGLWLVRQVADRLDLRSGPRGTQAVVTFALPQSEDH
jgi:anti-sigma regulatory factor (Ser/Thr protein kinase)